MDFGKVGRRNADTRGTPNLWIVRLNQRFKPNEIQSCDSVRLRASRLLRRTENKDGGKPTMTTHQGLAAGLLLAASLAACATPPKPTQFDNATTLPIGKDAAWERLLTYFTSNNIQIKTIEKDSGVIYAERATFDGNAKGAYADCGKDGLALEMGHSVSLNVFVRPLSPSSTQVTVNTDFKVIRQFDRQTFTSPCLSKGLLETEILAALR